MMKGAGRRLEWRSRKRLGLESSLACASATLLWFMRKSII